MNGCSSPTRSVVICCKTALRNGRRIIGRTGTEITNNNYNNYNNNYNYNCNYSAILGRGNNNGVGSSPLSSTRWIAPQGILASRRNHRKDGSCCRGVLVVPWKAHRSRLALVSTMASPFHHRSRLHHSSCGFRLVSTTSSDESNSDSVESDSDIDSAVVPPPWRVAIVGSGPSGCYTAKYLMMGASSSSLSIDVIERLPTPYGLVRNGVAPDHPEVKNVQNDFDALFEEHNNKHKHNNAKSNNTTHKNKTNSNHHEIRFYGNVTVGGRRANSSTNSNTNGFSTTTTPQTDVGLDELRRLYDAVVLAYGCESDRELNLPVDVLGAAGGRTAAAVVSPRDVRGILSAREFVNWYNGHPDYGWVTEQVRDALWKNATNGNTENDTHTDTDDASLPRVRSQNIVVVGHGNVALDCARILAKSRGTLDPTDLTTRALDVLRPPPETTDNTSGPVQFRRSVYVVGRRGHVQAAFTIKEARELTRLSSSSCGNGSTKLVLKHDELESGGSTEASKEELRARPRARIHKLLHDHAKEQQQEQEQQPTKTTANDANTQQPPQSSTEVHLRFLTNPIRFQAKQQQPEQPPTTIHPRSGGGGGDNEEEEQQQPIVGLSSVVCERTELEGDTPGAQNARGTGITETIDADLCLVSIGYKGLPIDDSTTASFDGGRGILRNDHGRVVVAAAAAAAAATGEEDEQQQQQHLAPLYVSGWLKRGPSGIIGTNIGDAKDTVASILKDLASGAISRERPTASASAKTTSPLEDLLKERRIKFVDWDAYRRIEDCESSRIATENEVGHQKRHPDQPREKLVDRETLLRASERSEVIE